MSWYRRDFSRRILIANIAAIFLSYLMGASAGRNRPFRCDATRGSREFVCFFRPPIVKQALIFTRLLTSLSRSCSDIQYFVEASVVGVEVAENLSDVIDMQSCWGEPSPDDDVICLQSVWEDRGNIHLGVGRVWNRQTNEWK